jgi:hypothetical protein
MSAGAGLAAQFTDLFAQQATVAGAAVAPSGQDPATMPFVLAPPVGVPAPAPQMGAGVPQPLVVSAAPPEPTQSGWSPSVILGVVGGVLLVVLLIVVFWRWQPLSAGNEGVVPRPQLPQLPQPQPQPPSAPAITLPNSALVTDDEDVNRHIAYAQEHMNMPAMAAKAWAIDTVRQRRVGGSGLQAPPVAAPAADMAPLGLDLPPAGQAFDLPPAAGQGFTLPPNMVRLGADGQSVQTVHGVPSGARSIV